MGAREGCEPSGGAALDQPLRDRRRPPSPHLVNSFEASSKPNESRDCRTPLSISYDRAGRDFVSLWEGLKFPIYGTQYHPERSLFEWDPTEDINHSPEAVRAAIYLSNFFLSEARKSAHR